jgi:hypothetical protein
MLEIGHTSRLIIKSCNSYRGAGAKITVLENKSPEMSMDLTGMLSNCNIGKIGQRAATDAFSLFHDL